MKNILLCLLVILIAGYEASAQYFDFKNGLVVRKTFMDFNTFQDKTSSALNTYQNGLELGYIRNFGSKISLTVPFGAGILKDTLLEDIKLPYINFGVQGQFHFFKNCKWINPFIVAGINANLPKGRDFGLEAPIGIGFNFMFHPQAYLQWQSDFRLSIANWENHLQHQFGFVYLLGNRKMTKPQTVMPEKLDSDGDGVPDELDVCPSVSGLPKFLGCPDTDGDGLEDTKDQCPELAGKIELNGCPDSDGDGITDNVDECPQLKGTASNNGCPDSDIDGDGVPDKNDHCPDKAGIVALFGCPDSDGDGVSDKDDRCPTVPGLKSKGGCPDSKKDADNDGIDDEMDDCPFTAGLAQFKGCPDTDGDGIQDKLDACPNNAGPASNNGCPVIEKEDKEVLEFAMRAVQFDLGKSTLKPESFKILDKVAKIMDKYDAYNLAIGGHTDNTGSAQFNLDLSEKRAKICYEYLIKRGISSSRMSYAGSGSNKPIADNKTESGRFLNRRTEFNLIPRK